MLETISTFQCCLKYFLGLTVQETSCMLKLVFGSPHSGGHRVKRLFGISKSLFWRHFRTSMSFILDLLFFHYLPVYHSIYCKCFVSVHICPVALLQMDFVAWQFPRLSEVKSRLPAIQRHCLGAALSRLRVKSTYSWMHGTYSWVHGSQI